MGPPADSEPHSPLTCRCWPTYLCLFMRLTLSTFAILIVATPRLQSAAANAPGFTDQVRPILSHNCFKCHGPDDKARKSGLRLDMREGATQPAKSGDPAIVPHKPDA